MDARERGGVGRGGGGGRARGPGRHRALDLPAPPARAPGHGPHARRLLGHRVHLQPRGLPPRAQDLAQGRARVGGGGRGGRGGGGGGPRLCHRGGGCAPPSPPCWGCCWAGYSPDGGGGRGDPCWAGYSPERGGGRGDLGPPCRPVPCLPQAWRACGSGARQRHGGRRGEGPARTTAVRAPCEGLSGGRHLLGGARRCGPRRGHRRGGRRAQCGPAGRGGGPRHPGGRRAVPARGAREPLAVEPGQL